MATRNTCIVEFEGETEIAFRIYGSGNNGDTSITVTIDRLLIKQLTTSFYAPLESFQLGIKAERDPTIADGSDSSEYAIQTNQHWLNTTTGKSFICTDATPGAAVWAKQVTEDELPGFVSSSNIGAVTKDADLTIANSGVYDLKYVTPPLVNPEIYDAKLKRNGTDIHSFSLTETGTTASNQLSFNASDVLSIETVGQEQWSQLSNGKPAFGSNFHITNDNAGNVYVTDYGIDQVWHWNGTVWTELDNSNPAWTTPIGLDCDDKGNLYVTDYAINQVWHCKVPIADVQPQVIVDKAVTGGTYIPTDQFDLGIKETRDPTVNDDSDSVTHNIQVNQYWLNTTTGKSFICRDATPGAAVWVKQVTEDELPGATPVHVQDITGTTNHKYTGATQPEKYLFKTFTVEKTGTYHLNGMIALGLVNINNVTTNSSTSIPKANIGVTVNGTVKSNDLVSLSRNTYAADDADLVGSWTPSLYLDLVAGDTLTIVAGIDGLTSSIWASDSQFIYGATGLTLSAATDIVNRLELRAVHSGYYVPTADFELGNLADRDPTVTDDANSSTHPVAVNKLWNNTATGSLFVCRDDTPGAAVWFRFVSQDEIAPPIGIFLNDTSDKKIHDNGTYFINDGTATTANVFTVEPSVTWMLLHTWDEETSAGDGARIVLPINEDGTQTQTIDVETTRPIIVYRPDSSGSNVHRWKVADMTGKSIELPGTVDASTVIGVDTFQPMKWDATKGRFVQVSASDTNAAYGNNDLLTWLDTAEMRSQLATLVREMPVVTRRYLDGVVGTSSVEDLGSIDFASGGTIGIQMVRNSTGFNITFRHFNRSGGANYVCDGSWESNWVTAATSGTNKATSNSLHNLAIPDGQYLTIHGDDVTGYANIINTTGDKYFYPELFSFQGEFIICGSQSVNERNMATVKIVGRTTGPSGNQHVQWEVQTKIVNEA